MLTACGRPQGGGGLAHGPKWPGWFMANAPHVDRGRWNQKPDLFCGRHKWMAPYSLVS